MDIFYRTAILLAITAASTLACESPFGTDDEVPEHARVVIDGDADASLRLVTSNNFEELRQSGTGNMEVRLIDADTALVSVPFEERLPLGRYARILVELSNPDTIPAEVRMQVFLGAEKKYDQTTELVEETLQFGWIYF